jgi:hypothetical protein
VKVLIDPVHTNDPQYCSANYKMQTLMRWVLERRDDVFFYYLLPDPERSVGRWAIDHDWLLQHPNVRYLPVAGDPDRMREYARVGPDLEDALAFNGSNWDWDIVLTGRSTQLATFRMWMTRAKRHWMRMALIEDEFPIMSFKKRVTQPCPEASDLQSLSGYVAADRAYIFSMASRGLILNEARKWLAPSRVRELDTKLVTAISRTFDEVRCKDDATVRATADRAQGDQQRPLTVAYTQRLSGKVDRQDDVLDTFFRHYALHGGEDRLRLLLTSNSRVVDRYAIERFSHLEVQRAPRQEFWRLMREEVDLILAMSPDEDYPLSLIEPVALGVPLIVLDAAYVRPTFGKDYPFIVKGAGEAYAMMREFARDYAGCYATFRQWSEGWFQPEMQRRNALWFGHLFMADLERHEAFLKERWAGSDNQIVNEVQAWAERHGRHELTLAEALEGLDREKVLRNLYAIFRKSRHALAYAMAPNFNEYRQILIHGRGWRDASTSVGHLAL